MINVRQQFTVHSGDVLAANMKIYKQFVNNARALQSKVRRRHTSYRRQRGTRHYGLGYGSKLKKNNISNCVRT